MAPPSDIIEYLPVLRRASQIYFVWVPTPEGERGWSESVKILVFFVKLTSLFVIIITNNERFVKIKKHFFYFLFTMFRFSKLTTITGHTIFEFYLSVYI